MSMIEHSKNTVTNPPPLTSHLMIFLTFRIECTFREFNRLRSFLRKRNISLEFYCIAIVLWSKDNIMGTGVPTTPSCVCPIDGIY